MWIRGNYHSYTFAIYPDDDKGYVENLFLHLQPDGTYMAFLVQYDFNEDDLDNLKKGKNMPNLSAQTVFYPLPDFDSDAVLQGRSCLMSFVVNCTYQVTVTQTPKEQGDLVGCDSPDCLYDYTYTYTLIGCTYSSTDCGGLMTTGPVYDRFSANGGSGGGGPKIGEHPIIGISVSDDAKHIRELNRISNRTGNTPNPLRDYIDSLKAQLGTATEENGMEVRKGPNGTYYEIDPVDKNFDYVSFAAPIMNTVLYLHIHHNYTYIENGEDIYIDPVPSGGDFFGFARAFDMLSDTNSPDKDNLTSIIISRNGLYAMRIDDPQKVIDFSTNISENVDMQNGLEEEFSENVTKKGRAEAKNQCNGCSTEELKVLEDIEVEKAFINHMKDYNQKFSTGIKVYKGTLNPDTGNYSWTKIID
ncbi:hypothetical protein [Flavobacterium sp.]|uniref:hypothetical protein n=1 Tax=Flavobacterium sp. TaxID=239 RepID=UPI004034D12B